MKEYYYDAYVSNMVRLYKILGDYDKRLLSEPDAVKQADECVNEIASIVKCIDRARIRTIFEERGLTDEWRQDLERAYKQLKQSEYQRRLSMAPPDAGAAVAQRVGEQAGGVAALVQKAPFPQEKAPFPRGPVLQQSAYSMALPPQPPPRVSKPWDELDSEDRAAIEAHCFQDRRYPYPNCMADDLFAV